MSLVLAGPVQHMDRDVTPNFAKRVRVVAGGSQEEGSPKAMPLLCFFLKGSVRDNFRVSWTYAGFGRSASAGKPVVLQTLGVPLHPSHELVESPYVLDLG